MRSIFGWSYPPGAENDPYAPYNQDDVEEIDDDSPKITVKTKTCVFCGRDGEVTVRESGYKRWLDGELVQNALPELTAGDREQIISGSHDACFDTMDDGEDERTRMEFHDEES